VTDQSLPAPPGDDEKYWFLGRQHRWLVFVQALSYAGVGYSLYRFSHLSYWTLICLLPLGIYTLELGLAFRTTLFRRRIYHADHDASVDAWRQSHPDPVPVPSVDVYLPTAGEDIDVLRNTYTYVKEISWPGELTIYVLDDAGRAPVADLATEFGFEYIHREGSAFKKAGNLNNAFHLTDGDFIMLFDADFVPRPDIVINLIPYMDSPEVGIVQSPQVFDTTKQMNWLERGAGATQELFYRFIQPSRDAVGAAICVGTSALYRRAALATVDGFPLIDHSEDMYTGISIKDQGYSTRYVPVILSRGTCPDTMNSFIMQQYRWCEGSLHMLTDPAFHRNRRLTVTQRMSFWAGILYYLTTAMNALLGPLPVLIVLAFYPATVSPVTMVLLVGPLLMWLLIYPLLFKYRWRLEVLRVQTIYSFTHAVTFWHMLKNTYVEWVPTGGKSTATPLVVTVRQLLKYYFTGTQVVVVALLAVDSYRFGFERYSLTAVFAALNLYVAVPVIRMAWEGSLTDAFGALGRSLRDWRRYLEQPHLTRLALRFIPSVPLPKWASGTVVRPALAARVQVPATSPPAWRRYLDRPYLMMYLLRYVPSFRLPKWASGTVVRPGVTASRNAAAAAPSGRTARWAHYLREPILANSARSLSRRLRAVQWSSTIQSWWIRLTERPWRRGRFVRPDWLDDANEVSAGIEAIELIEP
jgi:cellulose synthase (UDP-forming)